MKRDIVMRIMRSGVNEMEKNKQIQVRIEWTCFCSRRP